jgi:hypothetical protein
MKRTWSYGAAVATLCLLASTVALTRLPARSSQFARVDVEELARPPDATGFSLGPLFWDMRSYATDPKLEPFRAFLRARCPGDRGVEAALCLSTVFATAFAQGPPTHEFVDAAYDPIADLDAHMAGAPGHCVTRSGLVTGILLASSIPARQVQLSVTTTLGHNLLEVWDEKWGWVAVDPTFGRMLMRQSSPQPIVKVLESGNEWVRVQESAVAIGFYADLDAHRSQGDAPLIALPEPWLYLRSGPRAASWPFRGLFLQTGGRHLFLGEAQTAVRALLALSVALTVLCGFFAVLERRRDPALPGPSIPSRAPIDLVRDG